ncbi:MAG: hypothetical protein JSW55_05075 [Chloroflexota bacterium]|nr:MAG: hypothetical protein JSW55_05075 [Chloroflexota bacterium]
MGRLQNNQNLRTLYMSYQHDGVLELFIGWCVFLAGLMLFTEMFWMVGVYAAIFAPMLWNFKETVTVPRLRPDELDETAGRRTTRLGAAVLAGLVGLAVLGLIFLVLFLGQSRFAPSNDLLRYGFVGLAAVVALGAFLFLGYTFRTPRWYAYGALAVILVALAHATGLAFPWSIMAIGALIALTGSVILLRFLRSHPLLPLGQRPDF